MLQQKVDKQIQRMERRIEHVKRRIADIKARHARIEDRRGTITKHGGWDLGYWEGKLQTLEDTQDELIDMCKEDYMDKEVDNPWHSQR